MRIDKDIPPPGGYTYPWTAMEPGDSFFVPDKCARVMSVSVNYAKRKIVPSSNWTVRSVNENGVKGVRVWRLS